MTEESGLSHVDHTTDWRWPLVCVLAVVGTPLAINGLWEYETAHWGHADIGNVLYHTLQMYILHTPHFEPPVSISLQLGRWLIAGASLLAVATALLRIFREEAQLLRLRWTKGHVVVCGLGELGRQLTTEFRKAGNKVVAIESRPDNAFVPQVRSQGVTVLIGDASEQAMLRKARVGHARQVLATCSDEETNIAIATCVAAVAKPGERTGGPIEHWLFIGDPQLRATLKGRDVFPGAGPGYKVNVRGLDIYDLSARQAFEAHSLDHSAILEGGSKRVHLVIAGFGQMGQAIALQAARIGHFANGARMRITIVDPAAGTCWKDFSARYPQFTQICDVDAPCEVPLDAREIVEQLTKYCPDDTSDFLATYAVCFEPSHTGAAADRLNLAVGLELAERTRHCRAPVLVCLKKRCGCASLLPDEGRNANVPPHLHPFGMLEDTLCRSTLLHEEQDTLARALHEAYLNQQRSADDFGKKRAHRSWEELDEDLRESNRQAADHIPIKVRALGLHIGSLQSGAMTAAAFTPHEIELLAKMEHARWCAEKWLDGWVYGPERDDARKIHPDLKAWDDLPDKDKKIDLTLVSAIVGALKEVEKGIYR